MPARQQHSKRKRISLEKLSKVKAAIGGKNGHHDGKAAGAEHPLTGLAANLFSKAPVDFLERRSVDDLIAVAQSCNDEIEKLSKTSSKYQLKVEQHEQSTTIICVIEDRPFVVNTIAECVEAFGSRLIALLHPVVPAEGSRISLSYLETEKLSKEQATLLTKQIEQALNELIVVTDDFTAMLVRTEKIAKALEGKKAPGATEEFDAQEIADFLRWLTDGGFVFLGHAEWSADDIKTSSAEPSGKLGIYKPGQVFQNALYSESREDVVFALSEKLHFYYSKLRAESIVHRRVRIDCICIPEYDDHGTPVRVHSLAGFFTSKALAQESSSIPIIRGKLQKIIESEEVIPNSHDYKYLVDIIDRMPKDQALRLGLDALRDIIHTITDLQNRNETKVSLHLDSAKRGICVLVVMPRARFSSHVRVQIQHFVESAFGVPAGASDFHLDLSNKPPARFYFYLPLSSTELPAVDVAKLESGISEITKTWEENLQERLIASKRFKNSADIWFKYSQAFAEDYQALHSVEDCLADITAIEQLNGSHPIEVGFAPNPDFAQRADSLIVYNLGSEISISKAFPVLENSGLEVINEKTSCITPFGMHPVYVHRFLVRAKSGKSLNSDDCRAVFAPGLIKILSGDVENDVLNTLMLDANLDVRQISVLRAYCDFVWQISGFATRRSIAEAFSLEPSAARQFWQLFDIRFNPEHGKSADERRAPFEKGVSSFKDALREISDITRDRILRIMLNILEHTVRSNFFHTSGPLALKIESGLVESMPQPRPKFEIFVHSNGVQGVHLRSAMIARGGIRWSDRIDDYRSEVLGLVKTQTIKNAVIVPSGAKGGFVVRHIPKEPDAVAGAVNQAYQEFIRSLLSLTDNLVDGEVVPPKSLLIYDANDPYLVVAADKGTATFSDTANSLAIKEFDFWLNDAFASGGSCGYDHKKYGITARGTWECVRRHFFEVGIDYTNEEFTCVGIGDMSGDVFGNGAIYSPKMKLVGAFNHKHIFIDPTPDPDASFIERQRLFNLPKSQWSDYNTKAISAGGGIYNRFDKEITLSSQARSALGISNEPRQKFSGEEVISIILKAPVDLLWNGGIGTYVKSPDQTHAEVNDGTNDRVRVNADELRCKIVGEGGNLGFTQQARIDYARRGGRINTDAIDNSAGVDLSDHEVNIKILLSQPAREGKLSKKDRDELLLAIAPEVVHAVLAHNSAHALLLTIGQRRSNKSIEYYKSLVQFLHKMGYIHRRLECLPDEDEFQDRILKHQSMTSPELAICLAGVKMWVKDVLSSSPLCADKRLEQFLLDYFPAALRDKYKSDIINHKLARSIIASQVANTMVDAVGITFVHRMCMTHSTRPIIVLKCLLAADIILNMKQLRKSLERFDNFSQRDIFLTLRQGLGKTLRDATSWIISCHGATLSLDEIVKLYEKSYSKLVDAADQIFSAVSHEKYFDRLNGYNELKLDSSSARSIALAPDIIPILEMLWASRQSKKDITIVAVVFSQVTNDLGINTIMKLSESIDTVTKWEHQSLVSSFEDIRRCISLITCQLLEREIVVPAEITRHLKASASFEELQAMVDEMQRGAFGAAGLSIIAKQLRRYKL